MNMTSNMIEATRLTRAGRLAEAIAVLRGGIQVSAPTAAAFTRDGETGSPSRADRASHPRTLEVLDGLFAGVGHLGSARGFGAVPARQAPVRVPEGATFEEHAYANGAGRRTYKLYIPSGYRGQALPLVVMLHGCTQSPDDFAAGTRMNDLAEEQTFLVAYPAQAQSANPSRCWNWFRSADQQRDQGEPSLIAGITRQVMRDFSADPDRVYIAGLSAGGAAAAVMGATYPDLYAAIGVHSGLACGAARDARSAFAAMRHGSPTAAANSRRQSGANPTVPAIVFHGDRDMTVNPVNGDQVIAQSKVAVDLRTAVVDGKILGGLTYTRTVQTDETERPMLEQWVLHGLGHAWSGGSADGSYTDPRGPDASREMLRFFLQNSRRSS